jgi:hypothetical protein
MQASDYNHNCDYLYVGNHPICPMEDVKIQFYHNYSNKVGLCSTYKKDFRALPGFSISPNTKNILSQGQSWYPVYINGSFVGHKPGGDDQLFFSGDACKVYVVSNRQKMPLSSYRHGKASI